MNKFLSNSSRAPKSTPLRLEALESRELLDAASLINETTPPPAELLNSHLLIDDAHVDAPLDLSSVETLAANSTTWVVSSTADDISVQGTLRYAIANADDGDTITFDSSLQGATITLNGTHLEITKSITIDASNLWNSTTQTPGITVDGNQASRVFYVNTHDVVLKGIVITNGKTPVNGGGALVVGSCSFENCAISGNVVSEYHSEFGGGGVYICGAASFTNSVINDNNGYYLGGGAYIDGVASFTNCDISGNSASNGGGAYIRDGGNADFTNCAINANNGSGVYVAAWKTYNADTHEYTPIKGIGTFTNCAFGGNRGYNGGGAAILGIGTFNNCTISGNVAGQSGGGVFGSPRLVDSDISSCSDVFLTNCVINDNVAENGGGGGVAVYGRGLLVDCEINGNVAIDGGGAYIIGEDYATFINCLICDNSTSRQDGGGAFIGQFATGNFKNCTISGNAAARNGGGVYLSYNQGNAAVGNFFNSIVALNVSSDVYCSGAAKAYGYKTLSSYAGWTQGIDNYLYGSTLPLFVDATNGDYSLAEDSQAIDKGEVEFATTDLDVNGGLRVDNRLVDLGAYEYQTDAPIVVTSADDVDDLYDGVVTLREALAYAEDGDTITFDSSLQGATITLNGTHLEITKSITIDASNLWNSTMQTPGITVDGDRLTTVFCSEGFRQIAFKGLAIVKGYYYGIYIDGGICDFTDCVISECDSPSHNKAGVYIRNASGSFTNCVISDNNETGLLLGETHDPEILRNFVFTDCEIANNGGDGVRICQKGMDATFTSCEISGNRGYISGGGAVIYEGVGGAFTDCVIKNNKSHGLHIQGAVTASNCKINGNSCGIGIYVNGRGNIINCTISGNTGNHPQFGGYGVFIQSPSHGIFTNCTISGNGEGEEPNRCGGVYVQGEGAFVNSIIAYNYGGDVFCDPAHGSYASTDSLIGENPLFVNTPIFENGTLINADELNLHLAPYSPYIDYLDEGYIGAYEFIGERSARPQYNIVTTLEDEFDLDNNAISLREAVYMSTGTETISFRANLVGAIALNSELFVDSSITIDGNNRIILDGQGECRVIYANKGNLRNISVVNGNAARDDQRNYDGGGIFLVGDGAFTNCTISGNTASRNGGGVWIENGGNGTFDNCVISENEAFSGGGVYIHNSTRVGTGVFNGCAIRENAAVGSAGGGVYIDGNASFMDCMIKDNNAKGLGGGIFVDGETVTCLTNCAITDNDAYAGGGLDVQKQGAEFRNCTIGGNTASDGDGLRINADTSFYNSIIASNGDCDVSVYGSHTVTGYNNVSSFSNWAEKDVEGVVNYVYNPNLPLFADAENGDYRLTSTSQATNLGDAAYVETAFDLAGNARIANGIVDLGAYEFQGALQLARPTLSATKTAVTITVNWETIPHAKSYTITYRQMGSETEQTATLGASKTSYTLRNLEQSKSYYIRIRANGDNLYKTSQQSATLTVKTNALQQLPRPAVTAAASSATTINVAWEPVENAKSYTISYAARSSNPVYQTATLGANKTNYTLRNLDSNRSYYVKICANGDGLEYKTSPQSPTITVATPPIVLLERPVLTAVASSATTIDVSWNAIGNASSYTISYAVKSSEPVYQTANLGASRTSYMLRNLEPGTSYYIKIRANGDGLEYQNSPQSPTVTVKTFAAESDGYGVADYAVALNEIDDDYAFDATLAELADEAFYELFDEFEIDFGLA